MKTMRFMAALMIFSLVLQFGENSVYGDVICPLFPIDESNDDAGGGPGTGYWSYYGDICPGHGADLLDAQTGLNAEQCATCDPAPAMCDPDCVPYTHACQAKDEKLRHGAIGNNGVMLMNKNAPNKPRKLQSLPMVPTAKAKVTDLLDPKKPLFVSFTPKNQTTPIYAQLYQILVVPADPTRNPCKIFATGHEIDNLLLMQMTPKPTVNAIAQSNVLTVTTSVYQISFHGVEYQVITTAP